MIIPPITVVENKFIVGVHAVIINADKQLLVIKRSQRNDFMPLKWDLPGGTVEPKEEVSSALEREIREELSLSARIGDPIAVCDSFENETHCLRILFMCELGDGLEIKLNPNEHDEYRWVTAEQLKVLDKIDFLSIAEQKIIFYM